MIVRETVYQALFGFVTPLLAPGATVGGPVEGQTPGTPTALRPFNVVSRETIEVQRVAPLLQPVLFMDEAVEEFVAKNQGLTSNKLTVYFHIGVTSAPGTPAASLLNPLLDLLVNTLGGPDVADYRMNGLVSRAQFSGIAVKNLGQNSTDPSYRQAVAYVPFELICA